MILDYSSYSTPSAVAADDSHGNNEFDGAASSSSASSASTSSTSSSTSSVTVALRLRPFAANELVRPCVTLDSNIGQILLHRPFESMTGPKRFGFDFAYDVDASQDQLYRDLGKPMVEAALQGYNTCIFAYGQTGSGKTFSMSGTKGMPGLAPRMFAELYQNIDKLTTTERKFNVTMSYCELYNEVIYDLLSSEQQQQFSASTSGKGLEIRESLQEGLYVQGLSWYKVDTTAEVARLKAIGDKKRRVADHALNEKSSRSHCILTICIQRTETAEGRTVTTTSKMNLVDLAGSERLDKTGATGAVARDALSINKSLSSLSNVILRLSTNPDDHVPYRSSKLTRMLQESLGGNSKTILLATASPSEGNFEETAQTLSFASRTKRVKNNAMVNIGRDSNGDDEEEEKREWKQKPRTPLQEQVMALRAHLISLGVNLDTAQVNIGSVINTPYKDNNSENRMELLRRRTLRELSIEEIISQTCTNIPIAEERLSAIRDSEVGLQHEENQLLQIKGRVTQVKQKFFDEIKKCNGVWSSGSNNNNNNNNALAHQEDNLTRSIQKLVCDIGTILECHESIKKISTKSTQHLDVLWQHVSEELQAQNAKASEDITTSEWEIQQENLRDMVYVLNRIKKMRSHFISYCNDPLLEIDEGDTTALLLWCRGFVRCGGAYSKDVSIKLIEAACAFDRDDDISHIEAFGRLHYLLSSLCTTTTTKIEPGDVDRLVLSASEFQKYGNNNMDEARRLISSLCTTLSILNQNFEVEKRSLDVILQQQRYEKNMWQREAAETANELMEYQKKMSDMQGKSADGDEVLSLQQIVANLRAELDEVASALGKERARTFDLEARCEALNHSMLAAEKDMIIKCSYFATQFNTVASEAIKAAENIRLQKQHMSTQSSTALVDPNLPTFQQLRDRERAVEQVLRNAQDAVASLEAERSQLQEERKEMQSLRDYQKQLSNTIAQLQEEIIVRCTQISELSSNSELHQPTSLIWKDEAENRKLELGLRKEIEDLKGKLTHPGISGSPVRRLKEAEERLHAERFARENIRKEIDRYKKGMANLSGQLQSERSMNGRLKSDMMAMSQHIEQLRQYSSAQASQSENALRAAEDKIQREVALRKMETSQLQLALQQQLAMKDRLEKEVQLLRAATSSSSSNNKENDSNNSKILSPSPTKLKSLSNNNVMPPSSTTTMTTMTTANNNNNNRDVLQPRNICV